MIFRKYCPAFGMTRRHGFIAEPWQAVLLGQHRGGALRSDLDTGAVVARVIPVSAGWSVLFDGRTAFTSPRRDHAKDAADCFLRGEGYLLLGNWQRRTVDMEVAA